MKLIYHPNYNFKLGPLARLHPFDSKKYSRIINELKHCLGQEKLNQLLCTPKKHITNQQWLKVHREPYLNQLKSSSALAQILEVPQLKVIPRFLIDQILLKPMRLASAGTVMAAQLAMTNGFTVNLSGGYHHAKPHQGEGFCVYSDIALAIEMLREQGYLNENDAVAYVDLDAHLGNGVGHCFVEDRRVHIFDMFNGQIYPVQDLTAIKRVDYPLPLPSACSGHQYINQLKQNLPIFLDGLSNIKLVIYNAGTDIYHLDPLGGLAVPKEAIIERDAFVASECRNRSLPCVMVLSGGYTKESYKIVADSLLYLIKHNQ